MNTNTMRRRRRPSVVRTLAAVAAAGGLLLAAACTGSAPAGEAQSAAPTQVRQGGSLVIGSEQEPGCADWIGSCAGSVFGTYVMQVQTMPAVFQYEQVDGTWRPVASELMASEPTTKLVGGKQRITYELSPDAVWSDGEPITSKDLKYTALQIRDGKDIVDKTGYRLIESVQTPDAKTAVVTLKKPFVEWKALFSGFSCVLPSHLLAGKDRNKEMRNGYSWSGGPWKMESWKRGASVTLVPNERFWGKKPNLDKVTFQFTANTSAEFVAYKSGQLDAIYPSPQLDAINEIKQGLPNTRKAIGTKTANVEALWINNDEFPFDSKAVRQAFAYAIDRQALVNRLYGALGVKQPAQTFWPGNKAEFGGDAFAKYTRDLGKVAELMQADGWAKNGSGVWEKDGRAAKFTLVSLSGDTRRLLAQQILQSQLKEAGFTVVIENKTTTELFSKQLPRGAFQVSLWTLISTSPTDSFQSNRIPDASSSGLNFMRANHPRADELLGKVQSTLDPDERAKYAKQADQVIAEEMMSLPLDNVPTILLTKKKIGGPISVNPVEGPFWNLNEWGLVGN